MHRHRTVILLALSAVLLALPGCAKPDTTPPQQPAQAPAPFTTPTVSPDGPKGRIVFDMAHGEIFRPEDTSELGQSSVVARMQESGYGVVVNTERFTQETFDGVAAVYLPGPMRAFTKAETTVLDDYLERGGTVIMTIHVPYPVMATTARWGLPVGTGVMESGSGLDPRDPGVFVADNIVPDPLTQDVRGITVISGWPVSSDTTQLKTAKLVVNTREDVVADTNNSQAYDEGDKQAPFGVVGVTTVGNGRVVILGDDAIFANLGIGAADNGVLFDNILKLISAPKGA